jgi:hypothetical protein
VQLQGQRDSFKLGETWGTSSSHGRSSSIQCSVVMLELLGEGLVDG